MAGQSASLSLKEAREMQNRIQHSGSQAKSQGKGGEGPNICTKVSHQGKSDSSKY